MQTKLQKNNRLFYGKWPYKVECIIHGAGAIRYLGAESALEWCNGGPVAVPRWTNLNGVDKPDLAAFIYAGMEFIEDHENFKCRAEGRHFNLFCKDEKNFEKIKSKLKRWVLECYGPRNKEELDFMLNNNKKILCDSLPYEDFLYKVVIKERLKLDARKKFIDWANKQGSEKIKFTGWNSRYWFEGARHYVQNPFFYVKDLKTMSMVSLFLSDGIKSIHEYVVRDTLVSE